MSDFNKKEWEDLNVTRNELDQISKALKNDEFKKLFFDYCEEIQDPENRKIYEKEITQLEAERGVEVTFLHPLPGFVVKTSVDGKLKGFINIAHSEHIAKPVSEVKLNEKTGKKGLSWNIPYAQAPPRHDIDNRKEKCMVYDVLFHPDALHLADKNKMLKNHIVGTACDAVEREFKVKLDRTNLKFPKMKFKGIPRATVTRRMTSITPEMIDDPNPFEEFMPPKPTSDEYPKPKVYETIEKTPEDYATPKHSIKHRRNIDLAEMTEELDAKLNLTIPKEIIVEIELPLLKSTSDCTLDVTDKHLYLISEKPAKYQLSIDLPFQVNDKNGSAKFDINTRKLSVTLPVCSERERKLKDLYREDSGVESDVRDEHSLDSPLRSDSPPIIEVLESKDASEVEIVNEEITTNEIKKFLEDDIEYYLPEFDCNTLDESLVYVLHVKNVDSESIEIINYEKSFHLKFLSIGSGYYPVHYSFYCQLNDSMAQIDNVNAEAWDNNVIVTIKLHDYEELNSYSAGLNENSLKSFEINETFSKYYDLLKKNGEEPNKNYDILVNRCPEKNEVEINITRKQKNNSDSTENDKKNHTDKDDRNKAGKKNKKKNNKKRRSYSESNCDDFKSNNNTKDSSNHEEVNNQIEKASETIESKGIIRKIRSSSESRSGTECTQSFKGILKHYSRYGRSISGGSFSSMDDYSCSADGIGRADSFDDIPEEDCGADSNLLSRSCKKTVRFKTAIQKQLFRLDSSILGQKKKNQKRKNLKQRALQRRNSEGDSVDYDDKASSFHKNSANHDSGLDLSDSKNQQTDSEQLDIEGKQNNLMFHMEM